MFQHGGLAHLTGAGHPAVFLAILWVLLEPKSSPKGARRALLGFLGAELAVQGAVLAWGDSLELVFTLLPLTFCLPAILGAHLLSRRPFVPAAVSWLLGLLCQHLLLLTQKLLVFLGSWLGGRAWPWIALALTALAAGLMAVVLRAFCPPFRAAVGERTPGHGQGLKSIAAVAKKYHGMFQCDCKDGAFSLWVVLLDAACEPRRYRRASAVCAGVFLTLFLLNCMPALARALEAVPVLGSVIRVVDLRSYSLFWGATGVSVQEPVLEGDGLAVEAKKEEFIAQMREVFMAQAARRYQGYVSQNIDYEVVRDDDAQFILRFDAVLYAGNSVEYHRHVVLDKETAQVLELSDLFLEDVNYVFPISREIRAQMEEQMNADEGDYFLPGGTWPEEDCFRSIDPETQTFSSACALLEYIERKGGFDLYLLDILMPQMVGLELARCIRTRQEPSELIFLTISREYALDAFDVSACGYLIKPIDRSRLEETLLRAVDRLARPENSSLLLKTRDGLRRLPFRELVVVESFNHDRVCTLADGVRCVTSDTLTSLMERLSGDPRFFSPHRTYIINLERITALNADNVILSNGQRIPVAKATLAALKRAYVKYLSQ